MIDESVIDELMIDELMIDGDDGDVIVVVDSRVGLAAWLVDCCIVGAS